MPYHQMFDVKLPAHNTNKSRFKAVEKGFRILRKEKEEGKAFFFRTLIVARSANNV